MTPGSTCYTLTSMIQLGMCRELNPLFEADMIYSMLLLIYSDRCLHHPHIPSEATIKCLMMKYTCICRNAACRCSPPINIWSWYWAGALNANEQCAGSNRLLAPEKTTCSPNKKEDAIGKHWIRTTPGQAWCNPQEICENWSALSFRRIF